MYDVANLKVFVRMWTNNDGGKSETQKIQDN